MLDGALSLSLHSSAPKEWPVIPCGVKHIHNPGRSHPLGGAWEQDVDWDTRWIGASKATKKLINEDPFSNPALVEPEFVAAPPSINTPNAVCHTTFGDGSHGEGAVKIAQGEHEGGREGYLYFTAGRGDVCEMVPLASWGKVTNKSILHDAIQRTRPRKVARPSPPKVRYGNIRSTLLHTAMTAL